MASACAWLRAHGCVQRVPCLSFGSRGGTLHALALDARGLDLRQHCAIRAERLLRAMTSHGRACERACERAVGCAARRTHA
jgi:hypothetical protein